MKSASIMILVVMLVATAWQNAFAAGCPVIAKWFFLNAIGAKYGSALYQVTVEASKPLKASVVLGLYGASGQQLGTVRSAEADFTSTHAAGVLLPPRIVMLSFVWALADITSVKVAGDSTQSLSCESPQISLNPPGVVQGDRQFDDSGGLEAIPKADIISPIRRLNQVSPEYPAYAKEQNQQGTVIIAATISGSGEALATWVYKTSGVTLLDESALRGARKLIFSPARSSNGQPTIATILVEFVFTLD
jgi:TonB family protein